MLTFWFLLLLGLAHGVSDASAGWLLGHAALGDPAGVLWLALLYNLIAFGLQPLAGLLADQLRRPRLVAATGLGLTALGLTAASLDPRLPVALAGLGSMAFHAGAGALAISATPGRASGPGLFAAFGVLGLTLGSLGGAAGLPARTLWIALPALLLLIAVPAWPAARPAPAAGGRPALEWIAVVLLTAVVLRSTVWTALQYAALGRAGAAVLLAAAALTGKLLGGPLADRFGWRRWATGALAAAAFLLAFGQPVWWIELLGAALLQSATPLSLAAVGRALPGRPGLAASLALGAAILLGGVPSMLGWSDGILRPVSALALVLSAAVLYRFALAGPLAVREEPA